MNTSLSLLFVSVIESWLLWRYILGWRAAFMDNRVWMVQEQLSCTRTLQSLQYFLYTCLEFFRTKGRSDVYSKCSPVYYSKNESSQKWIFRKKSIHHNIMLIKVEEDNEKEECQAVLFREKGTILFIHGVDSVAIKMFFEHNIKIEVNFWRC